MYRRARKNCPSYARKNPLNSGEGQFTKKEVTLKKGAAAYSNNKHYLQKRNLVTPFRGGLEFILAGGGLRPQGGTNFSGED